MPRAPNLWKPEDAFTERDYVTCASGTCTNLVREKGDFCPEHQPDREPVERTPSNHHLF